MIKGITDALLMPRIEKIRIGTKNERNLPVALDYFLVPDWLKRYVGDQPKELEIMFPSDDIETNFPHSMKRYGNGVLLCRGNGETGIEVNPKTGEKTKKSCLTCPYRNNQCKPTGVLRFLLPSVPGLGIFQIDTRGIASIQNIISGMMLLANLTGGRIRLIPLKLTLEKVPTKYRDGGVLKDTTVNALRLQLDTSPVELIEKYGNPYPTPTPMRTYDEDGFDITPTFNDYLEDISEDEGPSPWEDSLEEADSVNEEENIFGESPREQTESIRATVTNIKGLEDGTLALITEDGMTIHVPPGYPSIETILNGIVGKIAEYLVKKESDGRVFLSGNQGDEIIVLHDKPQQQKINKNLLLLELKKRAGSDEQKLFKLATMTLNKDISNFGQISQLTPEELSYLLQKVKVS